MTDFQPKYYFFLGVGGIGMSALARYFNHTGKVVLGYDKTKTKLTESLEAEGVSIHYTDKINNIPQELSPTNTSVVYTPAIPDSLQEYQYFIQNGFQIKKRSQILGDITKGTYNISVAGTHGKTTTSAILGHIFQEAGEKSTAFLGGICQNGNSNLMLAGNQISITEADEYDRSFLNLSPDLAIITSTDADHLDIYGESQSLLKSFIEFSHKVSDKLFVKKGLDFLNAIQYSATQKADYYAQNIHIKKGLYHFDLIHPKGKIENCFTQLTGIHNVENTIAAMAVSIEYGIEENKIYAALESFNGVKRRFNRYALQNQIYIDDYAHHPTEIQAVYDSVKTLFPGQKSLVVFQPHLFSRTKDFVNDFARVLDQFDSVILLEIYPARELPIQGITSSWLASKMQSNVEVKNLNNVLDEIKNQEFDILLTLGAGNIDLLVEPIKQEFT